MTRFVPLILLLAACGADGMPERPTREVTPGLTVSGTVSVGITGGN